MKDYRNIIFILVVAVFLLQMFVMKEDAKEPKTPQKPIVALSTFSLYDIAAHISKDTLDLVMILPIGVDAHSYEPTPKMMSKLEKSSLVVYSGAGLEPWIDGFQFKSRTINMSKHVKLRKLETDEFDIHSHHDKQCVHSDIDPHYWLDVSNMILATNLITKELIKIEPKYKEQYLQNRDTYLEMLHGLDNLYNVELNSCYLNTIIVNHNAFSYLSHKYNFEVKALSGFSPETQVTPKDMIRVINDIKLHKVSVVFFESFVSNKAIKSLAEEARVNIDVLQPLGNITKAEAQKNLSYEDIMKSNLVKISKALQCK